MGKISEKEKIIFKMDKYFEIWNCKYPILTCVAMSRQSFDTGDHMTRVCSEETKYYIECLGLH